MTPKPRLDRIRDCLTDAFHPTHLTLIDDSEHHAGHSGHGGLGHFQLKIQSGELKGLSRIEAHRRIYAALGDLMQTDIHALQIVIL